MVTPSSLLEFYLNLALVWPHEMKAATEAGPFLECIFWFSFIGEKKKNSPCSLRLLCNVNLNVVSVDKQDSYYNWELLLSVGPALQT